RLLESGGSRNLRLHDQSPDRPLLHAGPQHDAGACPRGVLRRLRHALGLGLTLMCLRALQADREWKEGLLAFSFWAMNGGLMAMIVLSLLPVGLLQTVASVQHGYWYSRSSEFLGQGLMQTLRWLRVPGDTLFAVGAIGFVVFVFGLGFGYSLEEKRRPTAGSSRQVREARRLMADAS